MGIWYKIKGKDVHQELTFLNGPITRSKAKQLKIKLQTFVQEFLFKQLVEACETSRDIKDKHWITYQNLEKSPNWSGISEGPNWSRRVSVEVGLFIFRVLVVLEFFLI